VEREGSVRFNMVRLAEELSYLTNSPRGLRDGLLGNRRSHSVF
jgi:hypothetical protein